MSDPTRMVTPKLRFPEFRDAGGWELVPLGKLLARSPEYGLNAPAVPYSESLPTYLRITDIDDYGRFVPSGKVSVKAEVSDDNFLSDGDLVVARTGASVGKSYRYREADGELVFAGFLIRIRPNPKKITPTLLANFLTSRSYWDWVKKTSTRSGQPGINATEYAALSIPIPSLGSTGLAEQEKIAACLSSLDDWIAAEGRKLESLRDYKKGLMQRLFPRDGETTPQLRFPEFRDAGEWVEKRLGDLLAKSPDYGVNAPACVFSPDLPSYIRITDIDDNGNLIRSNRVSVDLNPSPENYLSDGDIVLARTGASVGKSYRHRSKDGRLVFAGFLIRVRPNSVKLISPFLGAFLSSWAYWKWVRLTSSRSGQPGINGTEYASLPIPIPPISKTVEPLAEQQRIADCLTSLDERITAQEKRIEALRTHKKGLMQQLFPSAAEGEE